MKSEHGGMGPSERPNSGRPALRDPARRGCPWNGPGLSAYVDGELGSSDDQATRAHLRACPECRDSVDFFLRLRARLRHVFR